MIPFIKSVARDHNVSPQKVVVNSTTLTDGILVRIEDRDYRVNLSQTGITIPLHEHMLLIIKLI